MRRRGGWFIRKGTAILLSAVLTAALVLESGLTSVGKVYAEETKTEEDFSTDQSGNPEIPAQGEKQPEDVPEEPETPPQGEKQPEDVPEESETPPQGEQQPDVPEETETLPQETVPENTVSGNTLETVALLSLEAIPRETHNHDGISYTAWERTDSLPDQAGNYYLTENVNLTTVWKAPAGTVNLCLNGKTITQTAAAEALQPVVYIENSTFNLYDCGNGGKITGGQDGGVQAVSANLNLYGGEISGNCIHINADGNHIGKSPAGGIYLDSESSMHMYGGRIANNSGKLGGGIYVGKKCGFVMEEGEVTDNQGHRGGGINVGFGGSKELEGKFTMNGGKISGNKTVWEGFSSGPDDTAGGVQVGGGPERSGCQCRHDYHRDRPFFHLRPRL